MPILFCFSFAQVAVIVHFVCLTVLWITRDLGGSIGWAGLFKDKYVQYSTGYSTGHYKVNEISGFIAVPVN